MKFYRDDNGCLRPQLYRATLRLGVVTSADYTAHVALRSYLASLADTFAPMTPGGDGSTGANAYLTKHVISLLQSAGNSTSITPEDGYYVSTINFQMIFAVRAEAWPVE